MYVAGILIVITSSTLLELMIMFESYMSDHGMKCPGVIYVM
jgi:hypothetical protein